MEMETTIRLPTQQYTSLSIPGDRGITCIGSISNEGEHVPCMQAVTPTEPAGFLQLKKPRTNFTPIPQWFYYSYGPGEALG